MRLCDFCCAGFLAQRYLHRIRSYGTEILLTNCSPVSDDMKSSSVSLSPLYSSEESSEAAVKECAVQAFCFGLDSFYEINRNPDTEFAS